MDWQIVVALVIAVPVILLPVAVVWYINGAGIYLALRAAMERRRAAAGQDNTTGARVKAE
jgi:hypothetical protein